jgi:hypothetical protein
MQCRVHSVHTVGDHHVWYGSVFDAVVSDQAPDTLLYYVKYVQAIIGIPWKDRTMVGINCMYRMYMTLHYCRTSSYYRNTLERKNNGGY